MMYYKTLKNIRTKFNISAEKLAEITGYDVEYIRNLEGPNSEEQASQEFVDTLKEKLDLKGAPITESEIESLQNRLYNWKIMIDYGFLDKAVKWKPILEQDVNRSFSSSTKYYMDLYTASFFWAVGNYESCYQLLDSLSQKTDQFNSRHFYMYYRLVGMRALTENRLKDAVTAFSKAERMDRHLRQNEVGLYYLYGKCLSDLGYVGRAVDNLKKAKRLSIWGKLYEGQPNKRYDVYIDGCLAYNLSITGQSDKALNILNKRLQAVERTNAGERALGYTYFSLGSVFLEARKYSEAISNFNIAFQYLDPGEETYKVALFCKAVSLIRDGMITEAVDYAETGLDLCLDDDEDELWRAKFEIIKHLAALDNPDSVAYLESSIIPILAKYEYHYVIVEYYEALCNYYEQNGDLAQALKYSKSSANAFRTLYEERIKRGL